MSPFLPPHVNAVSSDSSLSVLIAGWHPQGPAGPVSLLPSALGETLWKLAGLYIGWASRALSATSISKVCLTEVSHTHTSLNVGLWQ